MDRKFCFEERNVAFVIDNCPAHPQIDNLKAIKLYLLTPKTTSKIQPMDQGVIRSLEARYRKNVVRKIIQSLEKKKTLTKNLLLQGMQMLISAWNALSTQKIVNCFQKSGISTESQKPPTQGKMTILSGKYKTKLTTFVLFNPILLRRTLMPLLLPMLMLKL